MESITQTNCQLKCVNSGVDSRIILSPGQELHGVDAPALWHLVGHSPQVTHFDTNFGTFSAHVMIVIVPSYLSRHQQLETKTQEANPHDQCFNITFIMSMMLQVHNLASQVASTIMSGFVGPGLT